MMFKRLRIGAFALLSAAVPGLTGQEIGLADQREQPRAIEAEVLTPHAECLYFTKEGERYRPAITNPRDPRFRAQFGLSRMTEDVAQRLGGSASIASNASSVPPIATSKNPIDQYIYKGLQDAGVQPAERTNEYEFMRRVSIDLTGRPPVVERVRSYIADPSPDKRAKYIEELLASPLYVDRWTMYWGDRFKNAQSLPSSGIQRFAEGRDAFYTWIKANVVSNKPFDQVARELIATQGTNSWEAEQGPINWIVGGRSSGPVQDTFDQQTVQVATNFLGLSHTNCLLCHNGRGHLTNLSYWGSQTTRYQAWQLAAFLAKTTEALTRPDPMNNPNRYYWAVTDNPKASDYALNTTTGNRPSRLPASPTDKTVAPVYIFNGNKPAAGESYRVALAREITNDPLFATAAVNYIWREFFGRGIINPVDQIDPARLDPDNMPSDCADPQPCGIQPSNPYLLKALATDFANSSYDIKGLIRKIVNSEAYQLSSRWSGNWDPTLEPLFGRKLVRRLWAEEISDAIASTSNLPIVYTSPGTTNKVNWAIQLPEPITSGFLGYFLPGNRDDQPRRSDGSVQQALGLMNDATVLSRIKATTSPVVSTLQLLVAQGPNDAAIVTNLYLTVLTRPPSDAELAIGLMQLQSGTGATKADKASSLMWALYNKVDFIFNY